MIFITGKGPITPVILKLSNMDFVPRNRHIDSQVNFGWKLTWAMSMFHGQIEKIKAMANGFNSSPSFDSNEKLDLTAKFKA